MGKILDGNTKGSGKTKISKFKHSFPIDEKILWFEISMQNFVFVALCGSVEKLIEETLN